MLISQRAHFLFVLIVAGASGLSASAATMTRAERADHERQIAADYKSDKARCDKLGGRDKNVCVDRAQATLRVARAELAYNATGSETDAGRLAVAKSDADYGYAKARCELRASSEREACIREAKAAHARAVPSGR